MRKRMENNAILLEKLRHFFHISVIRYGEIYQDNLRYDHSDGIQITEIKTESYIITSWLQRVFYRSREQYVILPL